MSAGPGAAGVGRCVIDRVVVVVPAHDEEELLGRCLAALRVAVAGVEVPTVLVVVLDACSDASAAGVPAGVRTVVVEHRNVGAARAAGFAAAGVGPGTWCVSTDADTVVDPGWLRTQLAHAAEGIDVLVGTVRTTDWSTAPAALRRAHEAGYAQLEDHRHVHGANLGVRGSTYLQVGGFRPLPLHEDVDLVHRAGTAGAAVRWSAEPVVHTSARTRGRAPGGFADHLRELAAQL